jgi:hypothetical protein
MQKLTIYYKDCIRAKVSGFNNEIFSIEIAGLENITQKTHLDKRENFGSDQSILN